MTRKFGVILVLLALAAGFASADEYWVKNFGEKLGDVEQDYSSSGDKEAYASGLSRIANDAVTSPGLSSSEAFRILSQLLSKNTMNGAQLNALEKSIESVKRPLNGDEKEIALELIAFAKLDYSDKIATCVNTGSPNEKGMTGFMKDILSSNLSNYIKFVDHKKNTEKGGNHFSSAVSGQWSNEFTGSNGGAPSEYCRNLLVRVYSRDKKYLTDSFHSADSAIEGLTGAGSAH